MAEKKITIFNLVLIICYFSPLSIFAQAASDIKNFNTANGLPQNSISGIAFENTGYLWLTTASGVTRYDGFGFKTYLPDTLNSSTNVSNQVITIYCAGPERKILLRTKNGLVYTISDGRIVLFDSSINNTIYTYGLRGHFPNIATFSRFNITVDELVNKHDWDANIREILPVNATDFIVLSNNKHILFYYKNNVKHHSIPLTNEFKFFLKAGTYNLLGDFNDDLYLYDSTAQNFRKINVPISSLSGSNSNAENPQYFWDTYNDESYCYYNSIFYRMAVDSIAMTIKLRPIFSIENEDHVWTGIIYDRLNGIYYLRTLTDGLFQVKLKRIQTFNPAKEIDPNRDAMNIINYSVLKMSDSTVLTTTGLEFTSGVHGVVAKKKAAIYSNRETISLSGDTGIICADRNQLFYYLKADNFSHKHVYNDQFNKRNMAYVTLMQPEGDSLWVGTNGSISCITRTRETMLLKGPDNDKKIYFGIRMFYRLTNQTALISNNFGLFRLQTVPPYKIDTFPELKGKQVRHISSFKNALLLSVYKSGLYVFKDNSFFKVPVSEDQPELNFCHSTYIDKNGDAWIATDKGLFRTAAASLIESATKRGARPFFFSYGEAEGISNLEFNGGGTPCYALLPNGQIFYPSMGGIVTFNPADLSDTLLSGPIPVEMIEIDGKNSLFTSDSINLKAGFNYLGINLSVPHFGEPKNLVLEYKLDNERWKKISIMPSQRIVLYNVSAGYHTLSIRKRVGLGSDDYVYKTLTIYRIKHIYEQVWFYPAAAVLVILIIYLIIKMQTRNVAAKRLVLQQRVAKQTIELSKSVEAKELLINIISHDMVTPIRHIGLIAGFLEKGLEKDPEKISGALLDIESTSDRILTGSLAIIDYMKYDSQKVVVNRKNTNVYKLVNKVCEIFIPIAKEKNIGLENNVNGLKFLEIDEQIFSIILNNIISNAIKYSGKGSVAIFLEPGPDAKTILIIKDTGNGMSKDTLHVINELIKGNLHIVRTINKASTGLGYILISELIKAHGLSVDVESEINEGTTVSITIP